MTGVPVEGVCLMERRYSVARALVVIVEALVISAALIFLAEYLGWHLVREAGGSVVSAFG